MIRKREPLEESIKKILQETDNGLKPTEIAKKLGHSRTWINYVKGAARKKGIWPEPTNGKKIRKKKSPKATFVQFQEGNTNPEKLQIILKMLQYLTDK